MLSMLVPLVLLTGGAGLVLAAVAALDAGGYRRQWPAARQLTSGGAVAQASVVDAGRPADPDADRNARPPADQASAPPTYPGSS